MKFPRHYYNIRGLAPKKARAKRNAKKQQPDEKETSGCPSYNINECQMI